MIEAVFYLFGQAGKPPSGTLESDYKTLEFNISSDRSG